MLATTLAAALLGACASTPVSDPLAEYLDEDTGTTVTHLAAPLVFYREEPMLAVNVRDYVSLAPLELSQAGQREYLLWVLVWSTIDRDASHQGETAGGLTLLLDGEPVELLPARSRRLGRWPYASPVNGGRLATYRLSPSQLGRLAAAGDLRIELTGTAAAGQYRPWHNPGEILRAFALRVGRHIPSAIASTRD